MLSSDIEYRTRLRVSIRGSINFAQRRQAIKAKPAPVTLTLEQAIKILVRQDFRCALTGLRFWSDEALASFGPTSPSLDRVDPDGPYSAENVRIVLIGVNSLRGRGSDADMYRIARALVGNMSVAAAMKAAATRAKRDAAEPEVAKARYLAAATKAQMTRRANGAAFGRVSPIALPKTSSG